MHEEMICLLNTRKNMTSDVFKYFEKLSLGIRTQVVFPLFSQVEKVIPHKFVFLRACYGHDDVHDYSRSQDRNVP